MHDRRGPVERDRRRIGERHSGERLIAHVRAARRSPGTFLAGQPQIDGDGDRSREQRPVNRRDVVGARRQRDRHVVPGLHPGGAERARGPQRALGERAVADDPVGSGKGDTLRTDRGRPQQPVVHGYSVAATVTGASAGTVRRAALARAN